MKKITSILITGTMLLSLTACGQKAPAAETTKESSAATETTAASSDLEDFDIVLDWYPNAVHSFIYAAIENGYYAEEGLNVNICFPANTNDAITMTAAGKADAGLYYQPNIVTTAASQNIPIKVLGTVVRHPLDVVISMKDSNITSAKDLAGKTIGYPGTEENEYFVKAMMENYGLSFEDTTMIDVGFELNSALITGNVDAVIGTYINHEYPTLLQEGYDVTYLDLAKEGVPDYEELVLITGAEQAENESDKLDRFVRASRKGFDFVKNNPEEGLQILLDHQNAANYPLDPEIEKASLDILLPLMDDETYDFLEVNPESWQNMADWLYQQGVVDHEIDIQNLMINTK